MCIYICTWLLANISACIHYPYLMHHNVSFSTVLISLELMTAGLDKFTALCICYFNICLDSILKMHDHEYLWSLVTQCLLGKIMVPNLLLFPGLLCVYIQNIQYFA